MESEESGDRGDSGERLEDDEDSDDEAERLLDVVEVGVLKSLLPSEVVVVLL